MDEYIEKGDNFLAHHGIIGQRWGVRRYQNHDGSLTAAGRRRYGTSKAERIRKSVKNKVKGDKKTQAEREAQSREHLKEYLRKHPKQLPKYSKKLTEEEANEIISKIQFDRKLRQVKDDEVARGWKKVNEISNGIGTIGNLLNNSKNLYNNTAEIFNSMVDAGTVNAEKLIIIGKDPPKPDRKAIEAELLTMKPEDVLRNQTRYTNQELKDYVNRKSSEREIYDYTEKGKAEAKAKAETQNNSQNSGNNGKKQIGWEVFNQAVDNLGLSSTPANNLTQADWDRINEEIKRIKK